MISIIIPNYNQISNLQKTLSSLVPDKKGVEVIVVDGGSVDGSQKWLGSQGWIRLIEGENPRGALLNVAGKKARGDVLLFLVPGAQLERFWAQSIERNFKGGEMALGSFKGFTDGHHLAVDCANIGAWFRRVFLRIPLFSDGLVVGADTFAESGGFLEGGLFEDAEFSGRILKQGGRYRALSCRVRNVNDAFLREGAWLRMRRDGLAFGSFLAGACGPDVQRAYDGERRSVLVWYGVDGAKSLNERLIAYLSAEEAEVADDALTGCFLRRARSSAESPRVVLMAESEMGSRRLRDRFGCAVEIEYVEGEGLGARFVYALKREYERGLEKVVLIDPVCPDLSRALMDEAFKALDEYDVVLGPTDDGDCYLIAAQADKVGLFEGVDWSGPSSFHSATQMAHAEGASYLVLPRLQDLDDEEDFRRFFYMGYVGK